MIQAWKPKVRETMGWRGSSHHAPGYHTAQPHGFCRVRAPNVAASAHEKRQQLRQSSTGHSTSGFHLDTSSGLGI